MSIQSVYVFWLFSPFTYKVTIDRYVIVAILLFWVFFKFYFIFFLLLSSSPVIGWLSLLLVFLKEINPEYSLEGLMLKMKLQYFGHLIEEWLIGKDLDAGKDWGQEEKEATGYQWLNGHEFEQLQDRFNYIY